MILYSWVSGERTNAPLWALLWIWGLIRIDWAKVHQRFISFGPMLDPTQREKETKEWKQWVPFECIALIGWITLVDTTYFKESLQVHTHSFRREMQFGQACQQDELDRKGVCKNIIAAHTDVTLDSSPAWRLLVYALTDIAVVDGWWQKLAMNTVSINLCLTCGMDLRLRSVSQVFSQGPPQHWLLPFSVSYASFGFTNCGGWWHLIGKKCGCCA